MINWRIPLLHRRSICQIVMGKKGGPCASALGARAPRWLLASALIASHLVSPALARGDPGNLASARFLIPNGEVCVTRTTDLRTGQSSVDTTRTTCVGEADPPAYVVTRSGGGKTTLIWMSGDDLQPSRYQLVGSDGSVERQIDFGEGSLRIALKGERDTLTVEASGPIHNGSTLAQYLRAFAARRRPDRVGMKLLVDRGQDTFRVVDVFAQRIGEEDIEVPAGIFRCVKIEFGVAGIIGRLFWRTRYHYFYTVEAPHHFVKYVDPDGECIELVHYERVERASAPAGD